MRFVTFLTLIFLCSSLSGQKVSKKALSFDDHAIWNTIKSPVISNNGNIIAYELSRQKGDGILVIYHGNSSDTISRGSEVQIGSGNNFAVFKIKSPHEEIRKAKLDKVKKEKMPKDSLGIYFFDSDELITFPNLISFKISERNTRWIAFLSDISKDSEDTLNVNENKKSNSNIKQPGNELVLFNIKTKDTLHYCNVVEYTISKTGDAIYFVRQEKDSTGTRSILTALDTGAETIKEVISVEGWIKKMAASERDGKYAYLFSKDTVEQKTFALYAGSLSGSPELIVDNYTQGIPVGWSPSENGNISYSKDATKIYFGTAPGPSEQPEDSLLTGEKANVDIWNWKDTKLQPQQKAELEKEKNRTYLAVYYLYEKEFIQLADLNIREVSTIKKGDGDVGLGYNDKTYQRESSWTGVSNRDYYLVDFKTGIKREIIKNKSYVRLSPGGKYIVWYNNADSSYYSQSTDINRLDVVSLTRILPVNFYQERNDEPIQPRPYGIAGFSEDDRFVYIYDRYDIWKIDPSGARVPVCLTKAFGRRNQTRLRYEQIDPEMEFMPTNETILLRAFDERTMSGGYFSTKLSSVKDPDLLVMDKYLFGKPLKAREADRILWTKQNVKEFPDLWRSDLNFNHAVRVSKANADQDKYIWPKVRLVEWTSFSGENLKGLLYTPENLDPSKTYPMIVYFYERNAENLHRHQHPSPSRSTINKPFYVSNGYIVFIPDITYKVGYPGQSAYNAIVSGTQFITDKYPFIAKDRIGLQGQSWGGYQTAWLITQTDMFAAAMAGAPVSNMTSAYGGIRWQTGLSRMFQYEKTQSRIGGTLWEKPLLYIENSPLFHVPKINTPLLMMHNDNDGAVPWYQGIEMFVAMRRLNKPVWMLNYNGEPHNLPAESWANRMDLSRRMFHFFNHYLKDKPAPEWMEKGVSAIEKGKNPGY